MKKLRYWLLTVLLATLCVCAVAGCGGSKAGTYKFVSMEVTDGSETKTLKVGDKYDILPGLSFEIKEDLYSIELKDDGSYTISVGNSALSLGSKTGTWKESESDSGKVEFSPLGTTAECKGGKLIISLGGNKVTLKK